MIKKVRGKLILWAIAAVMLIGFGAGAYAADYAEPFMQQYAAAALFLKEVEYTDEDGSTRVPEYLALAGQASEDPADGTLHMICMEGTGNFRDLGGWACDGGTVRYGLLIRGATLLSTGGTLNATENDIQTLADLGIRLEIDLRQAWEVPSGYAPNGRSRIPQAAYIHIPILSYTGSLDPLASGNPADQPAFVRVLRIIMTSVQNGAPVYFHCKRGADRAATVAFMLEGLLGMSRSDMDKEFELTSFYWPRYRDASDGSEYNEYPEMVQYIKSLDGDTWNDKFVTWYLENGFSYRELNAFRAAMIDGTPKLLGQQAAPESRSIRAAEITGLPDSLAYTGAALHPVFSVTDGGKVLSESADYVTAWDADKDPGTACVILQGIGNYRESLRANFRIVPRTPLYPSGMRGGDGKFTLFWQRFPEADGYQIRYRKDGTGGWCSISCDGRAASVSLGTGFTKNAQVLIRSYAYAENGGTKIFSSWSDPARIR